MKPRLLTLARKRSKLTLAVIFLVTLFFAYNASFLHLDADYNSLLNQLGDDVVYYGGDGPYVSTTAVGAEILPQIPETLVLNTSALGNHLVASTEPVMPESDEAQSFTTTYLVLVEGPDLFTVEKMALVDDTMQQLTATGWLGKSFSVLDFVTFEKRGSRLATVQFANRNGGWTEDKVTKLKERIDADPMVKNYLVTKDQDGLLFSFPSIALTDKQEAALSELLQVLRDAGLTVNISGGSVMNNRLMHYLGRDLTLLLSLCFIAILAIYYLSFRAKRSVLLPFSMSVIGIIWTFGTMRLLGYSLTIVNIVTPCMVLNLGSSYAIHVIGEYYADFTKGMSPIESTRKILKTIVFACLTTVVGFLSLVFSRTPALREFGIAVGIGVSYCAILAATYLPAFLNILDPPKKKQVNTYNNGFLAQLVLKTDKVVATKWPYLIIVWVMILGGYLLVRDHVPVNTNYMSYLPKKDTFRVASTRFAQQLGAETPYLVTIEAPRGEKQFFLKSENLKKVYEFEQAVALQSKDVRNFISFPSYVSFANSVYNGEEGIPESDGLLNLLGRMVILMSKQGQEELGMIMNSDGTRA